MASAFSKLVGAIAVSLLLPAAADAAVTILGGGLGRECFLSAEMKRSPEDGIAVCNRALQEENLSRRDRAATLVNRGILRMHARDLANAIGDYDKALKTQPDLAEAHINRGIALLHQGGADRESIAALTRGLEMNPSRPEVAYYTRAVAHEMVGNVREAFDDYTTAAQLKPDWADPVEQLKRFSVQRREIERG